MTILISGARYFSMTKTKVFVYGTLKNGEPNHKWLTESKNGFSEFYGKGKTVAKYPLVIGTIYNIPFLLDAPGEGHIVEGEVYSVDEKMLSNLDILEDHPSFYERRQEPISMDGKQESCWTYFLKKYKPEMLKFEMYQSYSSRGPHNKVYKERYLRDPTYNYKPEVSVVVEYIKCCSSNTIGKHMVIKLLPLNGFHCMDATMNQLLMIYE